MRKNSVRKFVHMAIDILPLLIIPIFAININQKSVEPISIEVQEKVSVDFNQLINYEQVNYSERNGVTLSNLNNGTFQLSGTSTATTNFGFRFPIIVGHKYYLTGAPLNSSTSTFYINGTDNTSSANAAIGTYNGVIKEIQITSATHYLYYIWILNNVNTTNVFWAPQAFDLTQMFGEGNEPTIEEFKQMLPNSYYPYTESEKMLVNKPNPTTYNDTDIGSQFLYSLYKPVHDHFNFNTLFNMGQIYDWIQLNLFSGTAPLPIFIIWNIIVYEFFVDLIFLLYAVFMFVIDFVTCMIDSFMGKARKGV